jgi:hypothetical protein
MALKKRGKWRFGDNQADIRTEIIRYSKKEYLAHHFADCVCKQCGGKSFELLIDDNTGVAARMCLGCEADLHPIGDSAEYLDEADEEECVCPCGQEAFEITVGVSLYADSDDVRWIYIGCRCISCGLTAVYGDWKNEYNGFQELLAMV